MNPNPPRVLVVEDDPAMRELLTRHLRRAGFQVSEAGDAETALEAVLDTTFDLVLADIHLPGQSGLEMAWHLKQNDLQAPVLFVTGDTCERLARAALDEGAAGYLLKPFEFFELDAAVRLALRPFHRESTSAPVAARSLPGRGVSAPLREQRALARFRHSVQRPERVVLRHAPATRRRPSTMGWKAAAGVVAFMVISWLAGHAIFTQPAEPPVSPRYLPAAAAAKSTVFVPYMIETRGEAQERR